MKKLISKLTVCLTTFVFIPIFPIQGESFVVNVGALHKGDRITKENSKIPKSAVSDFQLADSKIDRSSPVNQAIGPSGSVSYLLDLMKAKTNRGNVHEIDFEGGETGAYNSLASSWTYGVPIVDSYVYSRDRLSRTITINGIRDVKGIITLTVWAIGDDLGQSTKVSCVYGEEKAPAKFTSYGSKRAEKKNATPYVQFKFVADGKTDKISFDFMAITRYGCLNGFSLSYDEE